MRQLCQQVAAASFLSLLPSPVPPAPSVGHLEFPTRVPVLGWVGVGGGSVPPMATRMWPHPARGRLGQDGDVTCNDSAGKCRVRSYIHCTISWLWGLEFVYSLYHFFFLFFFFFPKT